MIRRGAAWVIKLGGAELDSGPNLERLSRRLVQVITPAQPTVIVHGGGDEITRRATELGLPTRQVRGRRVTDEKMLEVVIDVLAHRLNSRLVSALRHDGVPACRVSGFPEPLFTVVPAGNPPGSLGFVGQPVGVDSDFLLGLLQDGLVPVVAPIGHDRRGQLYNVNADDAAGTIAAALGARLSLVTDVAGVLDGSGKLVPELSTDGARDLIASKVGISGMIPKLEAAASALEHGARGAWIGTLGGLRARPSRASGTTILRPNGSRAAEMIVGRVGATVSS